MKKILAISIAILFSGSVFAQEKKHMIEFNVDSLVRGSFNFNKSKNNGQRADNDTQLNLVLNYAYTLPQMPRIQVGSRINYVKDTTSNDQENYGLQVGGFYNHSDDLMNSAYASLFLGMQWNHTYGELQTSDENLISTLAIGKRMDLKAWGVNHVVYTPEIALKNQNSTTNSSVEYSQNLEFRFLQFSVFF